MAVAPQPQQPLTFTDVFDDDEEAGPKETPTVHHIRANSSIMQVKKILGEFQRASHCRERPPADASAPLSCQPR